MQRQIKGKVFVSYCHEDSSDVAKANELAQFLEKHGLSVFTDQKMLLGEKWAERISREIRGADYFVVLLSPESAESDMVINEVRWARAEQKRGLKILPLRLRLDGKLPFELSATLDPIQSTTWKLGQDFRETCQKILESIGSIEAEGRENEIQSGYLHWAKQVFRELPQEGGEADDHHPHLEIEDVYTHLRIAAATPSEWAHNVRPGSYVDDDVIRDAGKTRHFSGNAVDISAGATAPSGQFRKALQDQGVLVILGDPGSGKTTMVRWLALQSALDCLAEKPGARVPVYIRVAEFYKKHHQERPFPTVFENLLHHDLRRKPLFEDHRAIPEADLSAWLQGILEQNEGLVLLDGLDEVSDLDRRRDVAEVIDQFIEHFGGKDRNWIVVTSRLVGYRYAPLYTTAMTLLIQPMERAEIALFVEARIRGRLRLEAKEGVTKEEAGQLTAAMMDEVERSNASPICSNPLLLALLADLYVKEKRLPQVRAELYELTIRHRLRKEKSQEAILQFATKLAMQLHRDTSGGLIQKSDLDRFLSGCPGEIRSGIYALLVMKGTLEEPHYAFYHRTFQEFLAGLELISSTRSAPQQLLKYWQDSSRWHESVLLGLGHLSQKTEQFEVTLGALLDVEDPESLPDASILVCELQLETNRVPEELVSRAFDRLLESYAHDLDSHRWNHFQQHVEMLAIKLRPWPSLQRALTDGDARLAQAAGAVFLRASVTEVNVGIALLQSVGRDGQESGWAIQSVLQNLVVGEEIKALCTPKGHLPAEDWGILRKLVSPAVRKYQWKFERPPDVTSSSDFPNRIFRRDSLRGVFRTQKELFEKARNNNEWARLVMGLCGGIANLGILDLRKRLSSPFEKYSELDVALSEYRRLREVGPRFCWEFIFRDTPLTRLLVDALARGNSPDQLREQLKDRIKSSNGAESIEAALAYALLEGSLPEELVSNAVLRPSFQHRLLAVAQSLEDGVVRGTSIALKAIYRNRDRLINGSYLRLFEAVLHVGVKSTGVAFDVFPFFLRSNPQDIVVTSYLLAESWACALSNKSAADQHLLAHRLDQHSSAILRNPDILPLSLALLPFTANSRALDKCVPVTAGIDDSHMTADVMEKLITYVLRVTGNDCPFFKKWAHSALRKSRLEGAGLPFKEFQTSIDMFNDGPNDTVLSKFEECMELRNPERDSWNVVRLAARVSDLLELVQALPGDRIQLVSQLRRIPAADVPKWLSRLNPRTLAPDRECLSLLDDLVHSGRSSDMRRILPYILAPLPEDGVEIARNWLHAGDESQRDYAALWLVESGYWSADLVPLLIRMYEGSDCCARARAALVLQGSRGTADTISASRLGKDVVESLNQILGPLQSQGLSLALVWMTGRLEFDEPEWIDDWALRLAQQGAAHAVIEERSLSQIHCCSPEVWSRMAGHLTMNAHSDVRCAVLRSLVHLAEVQWSSGRQARPVADLVVLRHLIAHPDTETRKFAIEALGFAGSSPEDVVALQIAAIGNSPANFCFRAIGRILQRNPALAKRNEGWKSWLWLQTRPPQIRLFAAEALARAGADGREIQAGIPEADARMVLTALVRASDEYYVNDYARAAKRSAVEYLTELAGQSPPSSKPIHDLVVFLLEKVRQENQTQDAEQAAHSDWLAIGAGFAERNPAMFRVAVDQTSLRGKVPLRELLCGWARTSRSLLGREAALVMLGHLRVADADTLAAISDALRDVPEVHHAALSAPEYLDNIASRQALDGILNMLVDNDALAAYLAARVLTTIARGESVRRPGGTKILDRIQQALDHASKDSARPVVQITGSGSGLDPYRLDWKGQLPELCRQMLFDLQAMLRSEPTPRPHPVPVGRLRMVHEGSTAELIIPEFTSTGNLIPFQQLDSKLELHRFSYNMLNAISLTVSAHDASLFETLEKLIAEAKSEVNT